MSESVNAAAFELSFGGGVTSVATVVGFTGREQLSRPYRFDVTVAVATPDAGRFASDVLGAPSVLTMFAERGMRHVRGFVSRVVALAVDVRKDLSGFVVRLVPKLWTLGARKNSRIFQDQTVPEIVTEILDRAGVPHRWNIAGQHGARPYSVQYQETDLEYVTRLLAEEGIFYFFEEPGDEHGVSFVGGDVDQPMVIGAAHNGTHPPPFPLPASKTKSGIRTRSTPGGQGGTDGSNELSFEDAAGKEQIYVHAQRDLEEVVENDHRRLVRGNEEILVQGTRESIVGEDHYRTVRGNEVVTIEKDLILHVVGRQRIVIEGRPPSDGPVEGEGGEPPPAPTMIEPVLAAAASPPVVPSWLPADQAAQQLAHAKLVWAMAGLPEELRAQGAEIERRTTEVSARVAKLGGEVGTWLASGRSAADADALRSRTNDVRTEVLHAMVEAGMAVDARMSKLRDAAQHVLTSALVETQRAQIALVGGDPSRAGVAGSVARGGIGRGGGGALPTTKDKQAQEFNIESRDLRANQPYKVTTSDASVMDFSTSGKISSPVALALEVGGTKLTMTPAGIEIHAPFISLKSDGEIHIDAVGNVVVKGALITLN